MKLISHRGNIIGPDKDQENKLEYIISALDKGYDVEIDVWCLEFDGFYLGHDFPQYPVSVEFLKNDSLWCHAKDYNSLNKMISLDIQCFWHQKDNYTITNTGIIWTYPGMKVGEKSIVVCPTIEYAKAMRTRHLYGICSDYVGLL